MLKLKGAVINYKPTGYLSSHLLWKTCLINWPPSHRATFCKRCGVAPIRIETGRYGKLKEEDRKCQFFKFVVETETHVICDLYMLICVIIQKCKCYL